MSLLGFLKWTLVVAALPCLIKVFQGLVMQKTTRSYDFVFFTVWGDLELLTGSAAVTWGLINLGLFVVLLAAAWAVWFFWEQYED